MTVRVGTLTCLFLRLYLLSEQWHTQKHQSMATERRDLWFLESYETFQNKTAIPSAYLPIGLRPYSWLPEAEWSAHLNRFAGLQTPRPPRFSICVSIHCSRHILMSKQSLDCTNIGPVIKKVGREGSDGVFCGPPSGVTQQVL